MLFGNEYLNIIISSAVVCLFIVAWQKRKTYAGRASAWPKLSKLCASMASQASAR